MENIQYSLLIYLLFLPLVWSVNTKYFKLGGIFLYELKFDINDWQFWHLFLLDSLYGYLNRCRKGRNPIKPQKLNNTLTGYNKVRIKVIIIRMVPIHCYFDLEPLFYIRIQFFFLEYCNGGRGSWWTLAMHWWWIDFWKWGPMSSHWKTGRIPQAYTQLFQSYKVRIFNYQTDFDLLHYSYVNLIASLSWVNQCKG